MSLLLLFRNSGTVHTLGVSGAITPTSVIGRLSSKFFSGSATPTSQLLNGYARSTAGVVGPTSSVLKNTEKQSAGAIAPTGAWAGLRTRILSVAGSLTPTSALLISRTVMLAVAGALTPAGSLTRSYFKGLAGAIVPSSTLRKQISKFFAGVLGLVSTLVSRRVTPSTVVVNIASVDRSEYVRLGSLEVEDVLNDAPNRCSFVCVDLVPVEGQVITVTRGLTADLEFAGHVLSVRQFYEGILGNVAYHVTCQDYTWKLDRRLVTKRWVNVSATTIAQQIMSGFTSGFTSDNVVAGLATVAEFECRLEEPSRALTRLCAEIGGHWYVDYELDLHLFITESADAPDDISDATLATTTARGLAHVGDLGQVRTRVTGTGGVTAAGESMAVSSTTLPVDDATMFESGGGSFISKANIGTYGSRHLGGTAGTVAGNVTAPGASAPSAAVASGVVGGLVGNYAYKVAFANSQGETIPGNASNTATGVAFAAPSNASVAAAGAIGKLLGVYLYVVTYVTSLGETTAGSSFGRTAVAVAAPGAATVSAGSTIGRFIAGTYRYRLAFRTAYGLTEGGTVFSRTSNSTATPSGPSISVVSSTIGKLIGTYGYKVVTGSPYGESAASSAGSRTANAQGGPGGCSHSANAIGPLKGNYSWKTSYVNADGYEVLGSASSTFSHTGSVANSPSISGSGTGNRISIRVAWIHPIYGESVWSSATEDTDHGATVTVTATGLPSGCSWVIFSTGSYVGAYAGQPFYRMPQVYTGSSGDLGLNGIVATSAAGTMGGNGVLSSIGTGPTGTVKRRIFRTKAGGSIHYLVGELPNNTDTTFTDTVPDDALGQREGTNLLGEQHTVSSIATGPTGTTYRDIYRTEAGGGTYYFLRRIGDNSTTSFVDNAPDTELDKGRTAPGSATSGDSHVITGIPSGPTGTLSRLIYRENGDGSGIYQLLGEIPGNVTSTYTDEKWAASELGAETAQTTSTAGGEQHSLTSIPTGPTGTLARRIYRTQAGASAYQFVGQLTDNSSTTFTDNVSDAELGVYVPVVNMAGANKITVSSIPTGGTGVTKRILYRTEAGGSVYKYVATLNDNVTTTYTDNTPDTSLGREALTVGSIGAQAGDTTLTLESASGFPSVGWVRADSQLIYYTGISSNTLTGIPPSGVGALLSPIRGGLSVVTAPFLSGVSGISYAIEKGDEVGLYVQRNDVAAQTALAALEGGDGIHEAPIDDRTIITVAGLNAACDAELAAYSSKLRTVTFRSRDPLLRTGKTITLSLGAPTNQSGDFLIQRVISTEFDTTEGLNPMRDVIAAPVLVSFQDVLRRARSAETGR